MGNIKSFVIGLISVVLIFCVIWLIGEAVVLATVALGLGSDYFHFMKMIDVLTDRTYPDPNRFMVFLGFFFVLAVCTVLFAIFFLVVSLITRAGRAILDFRKGE